MVQEISKTNNPPKNIRALTAPDQRRSPNNWGELVAQKISSLEKRPGETMKRHSVSGRNELLVSAAALIGCVSITNFAHAQSAQPSRSAALPSGDTPQGDLAEIVVTAQRRQEKIQEVPISITVLTADDFNKQGATNSLDLTEMVPGVKIDRVAAFTNASIRGVSTLINVPGADPNVATYIDGIYQANPGSGTFDLPDVQRIEVDKGPQGTLFGRNATGGAIQVFTLDPSNTLTGHLSYSYASFNDQTVKGYIAGPIVEDKVFASLSGFEENANSYYTNIGPYMKLNGISSHIIRAKLIVKVTDDLTLSFMGFGGQHSNSNGQLGNPLNGISQAVLIPGAIVPTQPYDVAGNVAPKSLDIINGGSGKAEYDSSLGVFSLTTSYNYTNAHLVLPTFGSYVPGGGQYYYQNSPNQTYQTELDLVSPKYGPFSYIAGLSYYNDSQTFDPLNVTFDGPTVASIYSKQTSHAYSAFGEATYEFTDDLSAILGARYNHETRGVYGNLYFGGFFTPTPPNGWVQDGAKTFVDVTPRFSLRDKISTNTNVYFTYSQGFKSGLFNASSVPVAPSTKAPELVQPEKLDSYEIGIKSAPASWVSFSAATFLYKYKNQQEASGRLVNGVPLAFDQNAGKSTIYGADLEGKVKPVPELTLSTGIALLHTRVDSFPDATLNVPAPGNAGTVNEVANVAGNQLPRSPEWTASFSGTYAKEFAIGNASLTANIFHTAKTFYDYGNLYSQAPYTDVGVQASLRPAAIPHLTLTAFGKNLTNNTVLLGLFPQVTAVIASWAPPRTYGFTASFDF
jgi:iron complex outermembrane receptor protein